MAKTYNGWTALYSVPKTYFTAPNGKRVYCNNESVATIFEYVAQQWNDRIEKLPKATYNVGDPKVRTGYIVIHSYRAPNKHIGTGNMSNHRSATGMDILGDKHPYEATNPPHLRGSGYNDGFSTRQRNELIKIRNEIGRNSRGMWILRLGIHFPIGKRDGMHVEIAPGITSLDVKAAAARLRAKEGVEDLTKVHRLLTELGYPASKQGIRQYQQDNTGAPHRLVVDGIAGVNTIKALEEDMAKIDDVIDLINTLRKERTNAHVKEEANQQKILDAIADARDGINVLGRQNVQIRDNALDQEELIKGIFSHLIQGFSVEWWIRNGLVLDKKHRQYPADPGSMADLIIQIAEKLDIDVDVYDGSQKRPIGPGSMHTETE